MALSVVLSPFFLSYSVPPERQAPVYDVEIIMRRIQCLKVVEGPFDDADDIYGQFLLGGYSYNRTSGGTVVKGCCIDGAPTDGKQEFVFFDRPRDQAVSLKVGQVWSIQKSRKIEGLDYAELMSLVFTLGARNLRDWEPMLIVTPTYAYCSNCTVNDSHLLYQRMFRLVRMYAFKSQIDAMSNGTRDMVVGSDNILELHYYQGDYDEREPETKSHIMGEFTIRVTRR